MKVSSNKLSDIFKHYLDNLLKEYSEKEASILLTRLIAFYSEVAYYKIPQLLENERVNESQLLKIHFGVKDLLKHRPLEYILEEADFYQMKFKVNENVLIPRPETEELVDLIWKNSPKSHVKPRILDIGCGSGCIAICLSKLLCSDTFAIEISKEAIQIAELNSKSHSTTIELIETDFLNKSAWSKLPKNLDIIVSNPPYIRMSEKILMQKNVLDYEPDLALFVDDNNSLIFYNAIEEFGLRNLTSKGKIYLEINEYLGKETAKVFEKNYSNVNLIKDLKGKDRFIFVEK